MEIFQIITTAVLSSVLTVLGSIYIAKLTYKYEYHKKLIDKRLEAYERVGNFLSTMKIMTYSQEENNSSPLLFSSGIEGLNNIIMHTIIPVQGNIWIGNSLKQALTELNVFLMNLYTVSEIDENPNEMLSKLASVNLVKIREMRNNIELIMVNDLRELHNINRLFK
jgi:hypothetical protein